ncbi:hypothetical protein ACFL5Z_20705 [Planctomycetota bacterium]
MMSVKNTLRAKYLHVLWVTVLFIIMVLVMMLLECEMATPAY